MLSFNIEGFRRNSLYLSHLLQTSKPKIVFLQEIWLPYSAQNAINNLHPRYCFKISSPDMFQHPEDLLACSAHTWHGTAIGWCKEIGASIHPLENTCDRFVGVRMEQDGGSLLLLSFYAPTTGRDEEFLESISSLAVYLQRNSVPGDKIIIGADSNCSSKSSARRQQAWTNFCDHHDLHTYTSPYPSFHHNNGSSDSFIDMFVASSGITMGYISQQCTLETPMNLSSHDPLETSVIVAVAASKERNFKDTYIDFNRKKVVWEESRLPEYQALAEKALSESLAYWNTPECIPLLSTLLPNLLVSCATMIFKTRSSNTRNLPKPSSKAIRLAQKSLDRSFQKWKMDGKPSSTDHPSRLEYTAARSALQQVIRKERNFLTTRQQNHLMLLDRKSRSKIFAAVRKIRGEPPTMMTQVLHTPVGTYHGEDVLEGFAADAEHLGKSNEDAQHIDRDFYKLCKLDNLYIFDFSENVKNIPPMTLTQLKSILKNKMKSGKACDIYQLTVEHLRNCGDRGLHYILAFINRIIQSIYFLSCPQIKLGIGTAIHKGKKKPISRSSSFRRVTVTPILGAILDYYIDPKAEALFRPSQSPDQVGFTSGISYLLAAIQRGECQRWAIDQKMTCFGVSLDGESAFPSVERDIQVRELYTIGERGDLLKYSKNTYRNTECHIKQQNKLSRRIVEYKGNRQGHVRASGHYKVYINPCLLSLSSSRLGFSLGPFCITAVCVADDCYLVNNTPSSLQGALDIISHYARRYQIKFNASKTKVVVTGSKIDMAYYKDLKPWTLNGKKIDVVDSNEHLGLVVSGVDEEQKNVDDNIVRCRTSLFTMLGPAFSFNCLLSPIVQLHLWRTCCYPVLLSGIPALPIRPSNIKSLEIFQNKVLRGFLKLSNSSPVPALLFLLGELPVQGALHIRTLGLFHNIWANPDTTVHTMLVYIMKMCSARSTTWANHVQLLCQQYGLPPPLSLLLSDKAWSKEAWNNLVRTKITIWHEQKYRKMALKNSKMLYLNVQLLGLSGRPHPALQNINTTQDAKKLRLHLKFLTCDYLTNERLAIDQPGRNPACVLCDGARVDTIEHVIMSCKATMDVRGRLLPELLNVVAKVQPTCEILEILPPPPVMTQFVLDCTSPNLSNSVRIPFHNPGLPEIYRVARDWSYGIHSERSRLLRSQN